jgi:hypothetical protein
MAQITRNLLAPRATWRLHTHRHDNATVEADIHLTGLLMPAAWRIPVTERSKPQELDRYPTKA